MTGGRQATSRKYTSQSPQVKPSAIMGRLRVPRGTQAAVVQGDSHTAQPSSAVRPGRPPEGTGRRGEGARATPELSESGGNGPGSRWL